MIGHSGARRSSKPRRIPSCSPWSCSPRELLTSNIAAALTQYYASLSRGAHRPRQLISVRYGSFCDISDLRADVRKRLRNRSLICSARMSPKSLPDIVDGRSRFPTSWWAKSTTACPPFLSLRAIDRWLGLEPDPSDVLISLSLLDRTGDPISGEPIHRMRGVVRKGELCSD